MTLVRVTRRLAWLATILTVAAGCDKAHASGRAAREPAIAPGETLDLAAHPDILFEVFGDANDPRMIPLAAIQNGTLRRIVLPSQGWRRFDTMYLHAGTSYPLYDNGLATGTVEIRRGMWEGSDDPLYSLPGCHLLTPLAAVRLQGAAARATFTVEYLASTAQLGRRHEAKTLSPDEVSRIARDIAAATAKAAGIRSTTLDSLDFHAIAFPTGVSPWPTIIAAFIDPAAENPASTSVNTTHLLVIADRDSTASAYHATFTHRVDGPLQSATFRRYFDHLDVTGDGVDEILLEGWQFGGDTYLAVMGWNGASWQQVYRTRAKWCLEEKQR